MTEDWVAAAKADRFNGQFRRQAPTPISPDEQWRHEQLGALRERLTSAQDSLEMHRRALTLIDRDVETARANLQSAEARQRYQAATVKRWTATVAAAQTALDEALNGEPTETAAIAT